MSIFGHYCLCGELAEAELANRFHNHYMKSNLTVSTISVCLKAISINCQIVYQHPISIKCFNPLPSVSNALNKSGPNDPPQVYSGSVVNER